MTLPQGNPVVIETINGKFVIPTGGVFKMLYRPSNVPIDLSCHDCETGADYTVPVGFKFVSLQVSGNLADNRTLTINESALPDSATKTALCYVNESSVGHGTGTITVFGAPSAGKYVNVGQTIYCNLVGYEIAV
tara:strand:- start:508 stop:909 length:402 start_codon:yes stop_codon:yes gene_type:complete